VNLPVAKRGSLVSIAARSPAKPRRLRFLVRGVRRWLGIIDMTKEESYVLVFLQERPDSAFSRGEIARKAVKRSVYEADAHWVDVPLAALVAQHLVEVDNSGNYQIYKSDR
jgi:hypothetical protein